MTIVSSSFNFPRVEARKCSCCGQPLTTGFGFSVPYIGVVGPKCVHKYGALALALSQMDGLTMQADATESVRAALRSLRLNLVGLGYEARLNVEADGRWSLSIGARTRTDVAKVCVTWQERQAEFVEDLKRAGVQLEAAVPAEVPALDEVAIAGMSLPERRALALEHGVTTPSGAASTSVSLIWAAVQAAQLGEAEAVAVAEVPMAEPVLTLTNPEFDDVALLYFTGPFEQLQQRHYAVETLTLGLRGLTTGSVIEVLPLAGVYAHQWTRAMVQTFTPLQVTVVLPNDEKWTFVDDACVRAVRRDGPHDQEEQQQCTQLAASSQFLPLTLSEEENDAALEAATARRLDAHIRELQARARGDEVACERFYRLQRVETRHMLALTAALDGPHAQLEQRQMTGAAPDREALRAEWNVAWAAYGAACTAEERLAPGQPGWPEAHEARAAAFNAWLKVQDRWLAAVAPDDGSHQQSGQRAAVVEQNKALTRYREWLGLSTCALDTEDGLSMAYQAAGAIECGEVAYGQREDRALAALGSTVVTLGREVAELRRELYARQDGPHAQEEQQQAQAAAQVLGAYESECDRCGALLDERGSCPVCEGVPQAKQQRVELEEVCCGLCHGSGQVYEDAEPASTHRTTFRRLYACPACGGTKTLLVPVTL